MSTVPADAPRLIGGGRRLLREVRDRVEAEYRRNNGNREDPNPLLSSALMYGELTAQGLHALRENASPAHAMPLIRAFLEMSARLLWAARYGWDRYLAWYATNIREILKRMDPPDPESAGVTGERIERADSTARSAIRMPPLVNVLGDIDLADEKDPDFKDCSYEDSGEPFSRGFQSSVLNGYLHAGAHGDPLVLCRDLSRADWEREARIYLISAVWLARAAHLHNKWAQDPVLWAYQWITRGVLDPSDSGRPDHGSYGDLGLPPIASDRGR